VSKNIIVNKSPDRNVFVPERTVNVVELNSAIKPGPKGDAGPPGPQGLAGPGTADTVSFVASDPLTESNVQDALDELATAVAPRIPTVKSSIFIEDNATATEVTQNVAAKVAGTFLAGPMCMACSYNGNRITYIGARPTRVMANASVDVDSGSNNQTFMVELRRNGLPVDGARVRVRRFNAIANGSIAAMIDLTTGDFVELWITNTTSGADPTVVDATIALMN
jgi:hypothetical protein